jgi:hypothetical protein
MDARDKEQEQTERRHAIEHHQVKANNTVFFKTITLLGILGLVFSRVV